MAPSVIASERLLHKRTAEFKARLHAGDVPANELRREVITLNALALSPQCADSPKRLCAAICVMSVHERIDHIGYANAVEAGCRHARAQVQPLSMCWACVRTHRALALCALGRYEEAEEIPCADIPGFAARASSGARAHRARASLLAARMRLVRSRIAAAAGRGTDANRALAHDQVRFWYERDRDTWVLAALALVEMLAANRSAAATVRMARILSNGQPGTYYAAVAQLTTGRLLLRQRKLSAARDYARRAYDIANILGALRVHHDARQVARDASEALGDSAATRNHERWRRQLASSLRNRGDS